MKSVVRCGSPAARRRCRSPRTRGSSSRGCPRSSGTPIRRAGARGAWPSGWAPISSDLIAVCEGRLTVEKVVARGPDALHERSEETRRGRSSSERGAAPGVRGRRATEELLADWLVGPRPSARQAFTSSIIKADHEAPPARWERASRRPRPMLSNMMLFNIIMQEIQDRDPTRTESKQGQRLRLAIGSPVVQSGFPCRCSFVPLWCSPAGCRQAGFPCGAVWLVPRIQSNWPPGRVLAVDAGRGMLADDGRARCVRW